MKILRTIATAVALVAAAAACADSTFLQDKEMPSSARLVFDTGIGFGSGGFSDSTDVTAVMNSTAGPHCIERTGIGFGSGGRSETCP